MKPSPAATAAEHSARRRLTEARNARDRAANSRIPAITPACFLGYCMLVVFHRVAAVERFDKENLEIRPKPHVLADQWRKWFTDLCADADQVALEAHLGNVEWPRTKVEAVGTGGSGGQPGLSASTFISGL